MRLKTLATFLSAALLATAASSAFAGEVVVSAAASLTNAFKDAAQSYEAQYPGSKVSLNFAASGVLLQQIVKGAPVDVFASADQETMDAAQKQGLFLRPTAMISLATAWCWSCRSISSAWMTWRKKA